MTRHERSAALEFVESAIQLMLDFVGLDFNRKFAPETGGFFDIYIHDGLNLTDKRTAVVRINRAARNGSVPTDRISSTTIMKKVLIVFLTTMLAFASAASSAEIDDMAWNQSNIKTLRAFDKAAVLRFVDPEGGGLSLSDLDEFDWYPAGDGKYELAVSYSASPDVAFLTIYWQDAPGKVRSQQFDFGLYSGHDRAEFADLNRDGKEELILFDPLDYSPELYDRKFVPNGTWPKVYRLRGGQYVEASHEFPRYYENEFLPQLDKAIVKARRDIEDVAARRAKPPPGIGPNDNFWQRPTRHWAALVMCRDKILRFLGRDPTAGLAQAREWMTSPDPVMVDNARVVFQDIGGHDEEVNAAKLATERASKNWPNKIW